MAKAIMQEMYFRSVINLSYIISFIVNVIFYFLTQNLHNIGPVECSWHLEKGQYDPTR